MLLRRATAADAPALADAWYAMLAEDELLAPTVAPNWRELLIGDFTSGMASGAQHWYVIEENGRIVATGGAFVRRDPVLTALLGVQATLAGVYTAPEHRRQGYATRIMEALIGFCKSEGWEYVRLRASRQGRTLYERLGFEPGDEMVLPRPVSP